MGRGVWLCAEFQVLYRCWLPVSGGNTSGEGTRGAVVNPSAAAVKLKRLCVPETTGVAHLVPTEPNSPFFSKTQSTRTLSLVHAVPFSETKTTSHIKPADGCSDCQLTVVSVGWI